MKFEHLLAIIAKKVEESIAALPTPSRGPRGERGSPGEDGRDGKDFVLAEHEEFFRNLAKDFALKISDLSADDIEKLRGPRGHDGKNGVDGKDFNLEEHEEFFRNLASEFSVKFEDYTVEQIAQLRGPQGHAGRDGKDFDFEKSRESITEVVRNLVGEIRETLKLNFSDLSDDERDLIRGARGRDGRDGRDFNFDEHREFFLSLKPKFEDFTDSERDSLRLKFSQLTDEEKSQLKLRFEDLTDDDKAKIRGPRGPKGQRGPVGSSGADGQNGKQGPRGLPGPIGMSGRAGIDGRDGKNGANGKDAPFITDIRVDQTKAEEAEFVFEFSDGTEIRTNAVQLPRSNVFIGGGGGFSTVGGGNGGGSGEQGPPGEDGKSAYEIAVENGFVGTEVEWLASLVGPAGEDGQDGAQGPAGPTGPQGPPGSSTGTPSLSGVACDESVYEGALVYLERVNVTPSMMSDWTSLSEVPEMTAENYDTEARNALADDEETSDVIGFVNYKPSPTSCDITPFGEMPDDFILLDVRSRYYLSDTVPGGMTKEAPTEPGHVRLRVGRPISNTKFFFDREYDAVVNE